MKLSERVNSRPIHRLIKLLPDRKELPLLILLVGGGFTAMGLGADLIGIGSAGFGPKQLTVVFIGIAIFTSGIALDLTVGQRSIVKWDALIAIDINQLGKFLSVAIQLGLLVLVIRQFHLVNQMFYQKIAGLTFLGFLIQYFLPFRYHLRFFLILSMTGILAVLGLSQSVWLIGIGLFLIGICHLRISFLTRITALLITGIFLAILRSDLIHVPWLTAIWPVLGSMFMFRLIIYLYDYRHEKSPMSIDHTLSYFFLLPNVVFPFFPVVDYKTFRRTYYDSDRYWIYQKGVEWMLKGITHLIIYRFVYYYLMISSIDVANPGALVRHLISNYLLYLRVSGQFHLIVGMLHLFGFHLPETHHLYYLASGFNDFWRRINIYWKDFMMKVFYYPAYFRLRKWGTTIAMVLATLFVFLFTWFFHSYQWFWLRGSFPLVLTDVLFWTILALLVVANSLYEAKYGRKRILGKQSWTLRGLFSLAFRTAGTFAIMCILWSLWTSASLSEWFSLWSFTGGTPDRASNLNTTFVFEALVILTAFIAISLILRFWSSRGKSKRTTRKQSVFFKSVAVNAALITLLYVIGNPVTSSRLGVRSQELMRDLRVAGLNQRDTDLLKRNYYEDLIEVHRFNTQLWEIYTNKPNDWPKISETRASRATGDFLKLELRPMAAISFHGASLRTNRWGMRDRDYDMDKPSGTFRIALLGASHTMGSGVADEQTFEWHLEERLNSEGVRGRPHKRYEILNFAVASYTPLQSLRALENKVFAFKPDAVFFIGHLIDKQDIVLHLAESIHVGVDIPYDYLNETAQRAGIAGETSRNITEKRLKPFADEMLAWVYRRVAENCRDRGVHPVWVFLPTAGINTPEEDVANLIRDAEKAGFKILDLSDVFENHDVKSLHVAEWDWHPNAKGHKLIANRLYDQLLKRRDIFSVSYNVRKN
jgi:hypothetical protein